MNTTNVKIKNIQYDTNFQKSIYLYFAIFCLSILFFISYFFQLDCFLFSGINIKPIAILTLGTSFAGVFIYFYIKSRIQDNHIISFSYYNICVYFGFFYLSVIDIYFIFFSNYPEFPFMLFACILTIMITVFYVPVSDFLIICVVYTFILFPFIYQKLGIFYLIITVIYIGILSFVNYLLVHYSNKIIEQSFTLEQTNNHLTHDLLQKTKTLEMQLTKTHLIQDKTIINLANLIENRDSDTGSHIKRTQDLVEKIICALKDENLYSDILTDEYCKLTIKASPLHDIGKISISDIILNAPRKLTDDEFEIIKTHTTKGAEIAEDVLEEIEEEKYIRITKEIILYHHERWDGTGYPCQLKKQEIPLCARIMAIADVYDALTQERCYKTAFSKDKAIEIMKKGSGTQFDPVILGIFLAKVVA